MAAIYLHDHQEFSSLLTILWEKTNIERSLIEKEVLVRIRKFVDKL